MQARRLLWIGLFTAIPFALPAATASATSLPASPLSDPIQAVSLPEPQSSSPAVPAALAPAAQTVPMQAPAAVIQEAIPDAKVLIAEAVTAPMTSWLLDFNSALGIPDSPFGELIYQVASRHSLNPHLVAALIHVESAFNPRAVSRKGACGLMQLLPETARRFGLKKKEIFDPTKNLEAGVRYLKWLSDRFDGDPVRVLAAYNAGEGAVERHGGVPPYRETQSYVRKIYKLLHLPWGEDAGAPTASGGAAPPVEIAATQVVAVR